MNEAYNEWDYVYHDDMYRCIHKTTNNRHNRKQDNGTHFQSFEHRISADARPKNPVKASNIKATVANPPAWTFTHSQIIFMAIKLNYDGCDGHILCMFKAAFCALKALWCSSKSREKSPRK